LSCRSLFLFLAFLLCIPLPLSAAVTLDVKVKGVKDSVYDNVLARLKIYLHRESRRLTEFEIRRLHHKAKADIEEALAPFGYYSPTINDSLEKRGETWYALYVIIPGEPVRVKSVVVTAEGPGQAEFSGERKRFPLQAGAVLHQGVYEQGKKQLVRSALKKGFLTARFTRHELRVDRSRKEADIVLTLDTGPRFLFGQTSSEQQIIKPELLARYLPYKTGDPWSPAKIQELQKVLYRTDFFSRVSVRGEVDQAEDLQIPVTVELETPEHLNRYGFGLGYATDTGARGRLEWRNRLLNTLGHKAQGALQVAERENSFTFRYDMPRGNPQYDSYMLSTSYHDQNWDDTQTRLLVAGAALEHDGPVFHYGGSLEVRDETYDVGNTSGDSGLIMPGANLSLIWADNLLHTRNGLQLGVQLNGASEQVGSDATFLQATGTGKLIFTPFDPWRVIGRGALGATLVDSIDDLPPSLRFYAGGDQSIRGYGYKELGTRDDSGTVVGGRYLVVGSVELERLINERWSLATFFDVGNAMDDPDIDFEQGAGLGVRFRLPFGQVRMDLASAISEEGYPLRLHLSVGGDL
jgi:translocation and assembly module TamA